MAAEDADRRERVRTALADGGLAGLIVGPSSDWRYLTGLAIPIPTRLSLVILPVTGNPRIVTPLLEAPAQGSAGTGVEIVTWLDGADPIETARAAIADAGLAAGACVAVSSQLWARYLLPLIERTDTRFVDGTELLQDVRCVKSMSEVESLERAAAAADGAVTAFRSLRFEGRTEAEIGADMDRLLHEAGHEHVDFVIVGSGPNGANPHHTVGPRRIERGDLIVVDVGGVVDGFHSDITRMFAVGDPGGEALRIHELVRRAHAAAATRIRPGVSAESVDGEARAVIDDAGLGDRFIHRTGHGLGIDEHEAPFLVAGETRPLEPGMVFSIEPGVYLPGRFGVRIEDIYVCTADGGRRLGRLDQDVIEVS